MSIDTNQTATDQSKPSDKEINFRKQEQMYQRLLAEKEAELAEVRRAIPRNDQDDERDDDPYIDRRKLAKEMNKNNEQVIKATKTEIQNAVQQAISEERRQNWLKTNSDFQQVMQYAQKFAEADPELAETILEMPDTFERQKLVYKNIKALGLHKPPEEKSTIQQTIDKNRRSPYYQPSGVGSAPYASSGDFSSGGQENAYKKQQELIKRLRLS